MRDRMAIRQEIITLAPTLNFNGLRTGNLLGCGDYGCVFTTSNPGVVIKIGSQWSEFAFVRRILDLGLEHPMLPIIWDAMSLPTNSGFTEPCYAIIREDIPDLPFPIAWLDERLADLEYDLEQCDNADEIYDLAVTILQKRPGSLHDEAVFEQIVEFAAWCLERKILLGDLLAINFGRTASGQIKLRDLGGARLS